MCKYKNVNTIKHKKYYFKTEMREDFNKIHSTLEYSQFMEISYSFLCQILRGQRHATKHLAYALSRYAGKGIDYYFESED